ncbi:gliding motility-associated C-terminal domain-containing protein [Myroides sp. 1354]|uniref:gliding motility-associated C-terminal domain-containing protein n=1 Tax=unclassified Myroides TaxID=2642485 RepID=UPI002577AED5|nr:MULTISPECIES: gliding motility-associated C-terminal domain-containing protein [unclassified Myroides]MDM1043456.1 gliding motility-associated C-terminal domain-containing protein [Myroides sp. R163-1]MDM1054493.1 gliding motility-associated C-terminal domain-containing protein [Myroides sp. 1354]MDM1067790.1 gliding motility-associated C-terminal domain-containing protein [Myroides sp. 1372]
MRINHKILLGTLALTGGLAFGQTVNYGGLYIMPNTEMATLFSMENKKDAMVFNNGTLYVYQNLTNDGIFDFREEGKLKNSGKTIFTANKQQTIGGSEWIRFNNLEFNNSTVESAFYLNNGISAKGEVDFLDGIVTFEEKNGAFSFLKGAKATNSTDQSHVDGTVDKVGNDAFTFPIGNQGYYRPAHITAPEKETVYAGMYKYKDNAFFADKSNISGVIKTLNTDEYWYVDKASKSEKATKDEKNIILELSWDNRTTSPLVLENPEKDLHIVRWDEDKKIWVDEGGIVDMSSNRITTPTTVKGVGYFTLATVKTDWLLEGDVVIYNIVTADGDGVNDYFFIDNIQKFPNNSVQIYNRWGAKVFETKNYDSNGNVFDGHSKGKMTLNGSEKLPSGTYYYVLVYEVVKDGVSSTIKKAGYLHLETN